MIQLSHLRRIPLVATAAMLSCNSLLAVVPTADELQLSRQWTESGFLPDAAVNRGGVEVLKEDSSDTMACGRSWRGTPFQIGDKTYTHGLAFNSSKHLRIFLGRPAARFVSDIGLENNDDTRRGGESGQGSVTFHVLLKGQEVLASPVMRLKDTARTIDVPLHGASEFEIRVGDGGDGRGYDQALWGGARIEMEDGTSVRLQNLVATSGADTNSARISFVYGGKPSASLLPGWKHEVRRTPMVAGGELHEFVQRDPESGLEVRTLVKRFSDFPASEWVVRFKNTGSKDTPLIENIQAMDTVFSLPTSGAATLHWAKGGVSTFDDFAPQTEVLKSGTAFSLAPSEGRSSSAILPFFNLEGNGSGVVLAVGWSGRWAASFESLKNSKSAIRVNAGMAATHLVLHPGEEIRTPSMLALFYEGNQWRGQNLLRQFILAHHRPQKDGKPMQSPITCGNWGGTPADVHVDNIRKFIEHHLPMDYYWIDAEWYGKGGWADNVGNWNLNKDVYPQAFKPLTDLLHADHRELMLWFEPERVFKNTPWFKEHREWLLEDGGDNYLMNLGNSNACHFVTEFISEKISEFNLGCYRQDFNMEPRFFWSKADAPDRQGMSEIRHIEGLYAFWDALLARYPHLIIDNCASGGRRIDLETIGRATPFWRTDGPRDAIAHQCHSYGLFAWVPLSAISQDREGDTYEFRSSMSSSLCINWNHSGDGVRPKYPEDFPYDWARKTLEQYVSIRDFFYGDYYPLTRYSQDPDQWMAYQLDRPDIAQGLVTVLRRPESPFVSGRFCLQSLDAAATYQVTNLDSGEKVEMTGRDLMEKGVGVTVSQKPGSALLVYKKIK
jgi:alpha-galactosidase